MARKKLIAKISVRLDAKLVKVAKEKCELREIELADVLEAYLQTFTKTTHFNFGDILNFGQFESVEVERAVRIKPDYFLWLAQTSTRYSFADDVLELAGALVEQDREDHE